MSLPHQYRIDAGIGFDWDLLPAHRNSLADVSSDAEEIRFRRERSSHRGIQRFQRLRRLWLYCVNQEFLEEVAELPNVVSLYVDGLTATDLTPLFRMRRLRRLVLIGGTKIQSLDWVAGLPPLESFGIENFKRVTDLEPLTSLKGITALALEGSIWTSMRVRTLKPLSKLGELRHLFLSNLRTLDRILSPLYSLSRLEILQCAAFFPEEEFVALRRHLPRLQCQWFEMIDEHGSIRQGIRAEVRRMGLAEPLSGP